MSAWYGREVPGLLEGEGFGLKSHNHGSLEPGSCNPAPTEPQTEKLQLPKSYRLGSMRFSVNSAKVDMLFRHVCGLTSQHDHP